MKLNIIGLDDANDELSVNAKGGTELMYQGLMERLPEHLKERFQIIPSRVRRLDPDKKKILWLHDLPMDPESTHLKDPASRERFDGFVFVSNWQLQAYNWFLGVPYDKSIVLKNAINNFPARQDSDDEEIRLIYHTTPHRGLEILVPVFEELSKKYSNIVLDVYSSFKIYGWEQRDEPYKDLFKRCEDHPRINYHGTVSNAEIRVALQKADVFAYPCIWLETSCIALIEAMSAGCDIIHPNLGALPESSLGLTAMYQWTEDKVKHAAVFKNELENYIQMRNITKNYYRRTNEYKRLIDVTYDWHIRSLQWHDYLSNL